MNSTSETSSLSCNSKGATILSQTGKIEGYKELNMKDRYVWREAKIKAYKTKRFKYFLTFWNEKNFQKIRHNFLKNFFESKKTNTIVFFFLRLLPKQMIPQLLLIYTLRNRKCWYELQITTECHYLGKRTKNGHIQRTYYFSLKKMCAACCVNITILEIVG